MMAGSNRDDLLIYYLDDLDRDPSNVWKVSTALNMSTALECSVFQSSHGGNGYVRGMGRAYADVVPKVHLRVGWV